MESFEPILIETKELENLINLLSLKIKVLNLQSRTFRTKLLESKAVKRAIEDLIITLFAYFSSD